MPAEPDTVPTMTADGELWRRAAGGDQAAFGELFERHVEAVWNHAYRLTGSWSRAEDVSSATFLTARRKRADVVLMHESALPWLFTVAANVARCEYRRATRFLRAVRRIPITRSVDDHADSVAGRIDADHRLRDVLGAIAQLPRAEREAVELCLLGELNTAAAASLLGVAEVRDRIRDAALGA